MPQRFGKPYPASICADCLYMDANGWGEETGRPVPEPVPLSAFPLPVLIGPRESSEEGMEPYFGTHCDGCGTSWAGDRFDVIVVEVLP